MKCLLVRIEDENSPSKANNISEHLEGEELGDDSERAERHRSAGERRSHAGVAERAVVAATANRRAVRLLFAATVIKTLHIRWALEQRFRLALEADASVALASVGAERDDDENDENNRKKRAHFGE